MLEHKRIGPFAVRLYYFSLPPWSARFGLAKAFHTFSRPHGFIAQKRFTLRVDLTKAPETLLKEMRSTWRRHITLFGKMDTNYTEGRRDEFNEFFDRFAEKKGIAPFDERENLVFTKVDQGGQTKTYHAYAVDPTTGTVRLRHSSSLRLEEGVDHEEIGIINKGHHWLDFLHFKNLGMTRYDFGGAQAPDESTPSPLQFFKTGFGGDIVEDWQGESVPLWVLERVIKLFRRE